LLTGDLCLEVIYVVQNGTSKWWSLKADGRYSEVIVGSDLTIYNCAIKIKEIPTLKIGERNEYILSYLFF